MLKEKIKKIDALLIQLHYLIMANNVWNFNCGILKSKSIERNIVKITETIRKNKDFTKDHELALNKILELPQKWNKDNAENVALEAFFSSLDSINATTSIK